MSVSRRTFIRAAVAGTAIAAVSAAELPSPAHAASPVGDVVGKISVGYQGWFAATGDGSPINAWWHWSQNWGQAPSPSNTNIISWPDMREYTNSYPSAYANLGNGQPARLFSSYDQQTVDTHFRWMRDYGCDTAALQRFNPFSQEGPTRDGMAAKVRTAAEAYGRKFYIMYDVTNWTNTQSELKTDWTTKMSAYTASPSYARQNGKPVVCVWGFGFNDPGRPFAPEPCLEVVNWFKAQGCYVVGGVPTWWRTGVSDSRPGFSAVYAAFNMISPWMVGRTGDLAGLDSYYQNVNLGDQAYCNANGIDYQPCVMPGDLSSGHRYHGDFMWRHFYNMVRLGCQGIYISMFDEYNEGNQIAKTAENASMQPTDFGRRALDEDGVACSSDYYLRITNDGGRMLKGLIPLTAVRPTQPMEGPPPDVPTNVALGRPTQASSTNNGFVPGNAVDNNPSTYWESAGAFPQWLQVDLGAVTAIGSVVLKLPPNSAWERRTQTLSIQVGPTTTALSTVVQNGGYLFDPATGNSVTLPPASVTSARYVRVTISGNTGWPAAQVSELQVWNVPGNQPVDNQAPTAPGNLTSPSKTANSVAPSWSASTDNIGVAGYDVRQAGTVVGTTTATTFTATGLAAATAYTFTVVARDAAGNTSTSSNQLTVTTNPAPVTNLARDRPTTASGSVGGFPPGNAVNGDPGSYWESTNNAFPQWLQVDLGGSVTVGRVVLKLPPPSAWGTRTQTLSIQGSTNGSTFTTVLGSAGYTFNPATGNIVTITVTATSTRYLRLQFTGNTGWPAGQVGELEVYSS